MPAPLTPAQRRAIADDISIGLGRNATARKHNVSAGAVTRIARQEGLWFERCEHTALATECRSIDQWAARVDRENELLDQLFALKQTTRQRDGKETRAYRRLSYALHDIGRHAKPR